MSPGPSRWLAPAALLASILAVFVIITGSTGDDGDPGGEPAPTAEERQEAQTGTGTEETATEPRTGTGARTGTQPAQETYTVRPGDTLGQISERTGVPVEELLELNPDVDPNNLTVGEEINLTE